MSCGEFTDTEIREELAHLGYHDVPQDKLEDFKKDLMKLISKERSKNNSFNSSGTAEESYREKASKQENHSNCGGPFNGRGFSNHENQFNDNRYNEDWQYHGQNQCQERPKTAPQKSCQPGIRRVDHNSALDAYPSSMYASYSQACQGDSASESGSESRVMKRKTSRKTDDGCRMVDESFTDTDSGLFEIYEKIKKLAMRECECGKSRPKSSDVEPPYRIKGKVNKNPSLIKKADPPHTRNIIKMDINERHKMYKDGWKSRPPIGEDHRLGLRSAMHAKLMKREEIKMKQKVYIPNFYVPPHEKTRKDLRWQVRRAFENYELPDHGYYHDV